jgi:predicted DCC family thiol-disulfide oxidoreductase YuxK
MSGDTTGPVVLFDGVCRLCSGTVGFLARRDRRRTIRFAPLQSEAARRLLKGAPGEPSSMNTFVLVEQGRVYTRSDAALRVMAHLPGIWLPLAGALKVFPRSVRDAVYDWVARNRYRWFGRRESCLVPTPELRDRFLD